MTLTKVLEMLYRKVASGYLQATYIENGKCRSKCFQIDQLSEMESFIRKYGKSCNTYIDINPRNREISEPYWYAMLSNVALTADGHEMAHSLSSPYPGYSYHETEKNTVMLWSRTSRPPASS